MKSSTASKPKNFIAPVETVVSLEFEWEWNDNPKGILIDALNPKGNVEEVFFLQCDSQDVEQYAFIHGEEDVDFQYEKEWEDEYPEGGHYYNKKVLIKDNLDQITKDFIEFNRAKWRQNSNG